MNRKGFTLTELLAVIVIMSLVLVIAIPNSIDAYKKSRLKAEYTFVKRLSQIVDSYTSLYSDELSFSSYGREFYKPDQEKKVTVGITNITANTLINKNLISSGDYINPNNKDKECSTNAQIEIYKDSDFVYCHKIKASSLNCITGDYINEYLDRDNNSYIVDTCVWKESE